MTSSFGKFTTRWDVEGATIQTIKLHLQAYLTEMWTQHPSANDLPRINQKTVYGGLDFQTWEPEIGPGVVVTAKPTDESILLGSGLYLQWYDVTLGTIVQAGDEDEARRLADLYGMAVTAIVGQHGDLSGIAENTTMMSAPMTSFPDADNRRFAMSESSFRVLVRAFDSSKGIAPLASAAVASAHVTVTGWPLGTPLPRDAVVDGRADPPYSEPVY